MKKIETAEKKGIRAILKKFQKLFILLAAMIVLTIIAPTSFPTITNLSNVLWALSVVGIMVGGSIFVILLGGIDLSVGSMAALSGIIMVAIIQKSGYSNVGVILGITVALASGALVGLFHGVIVTKFKVPAFLITFATQIVLSGIAMTVTNNQIWGCLQPKLFTGIGTGKIFGFPVPIYIMLLIVLISFFILNKTVFGRKVYAVGGNAEASELSGINSNRTTVMCYVVSGLTAALGGVVLSSMTQQAMSAMGKGYETDVITAIVIGGTSLMGGEGSIQGAVFGTILVGLLNNGLNLLNVPATHHTLVKGIVVIIAVAFDTFGKSEKRISFNFRKNKTLSVPADSTTNS